MGIQDNPYIIHFLLAPSKLNPEKELDLRSAALALVVDMFMASLWGAGVQSGFWTSLNSGFWERCVWGLRIRVWFL